MAQLFARIKTHGVERGYAGDYSKYDLRMPAQLIYVAFQVMIDIAEKFAENYTPRDITVMRVLATEVACALTAFNGTLIQFVGSNPSGQNLTAYINSIVNSLLHRACFYDWATENLGAVPNFRANVALMTYGDDYAGSVNPKIEFDNIVFASWCGKYDMVVTPPDKTSELQSYLNCNTMDFLKRRPRFDAAFGMEMGILDEQSIYKMLHSNMRSKVETPRSVAANCMSSALNEWFLYGEETYESNRAKLVTIATDREMLGHVPGLELTFAERLHQWKCKYDVA